MNRSIPTRYNGTTFRSRLEARWAAFFDQLGWKWDYEPVDLKGYIPDFLLAWHRPLLVEVKPIVDWKDGQFDSAARKIKKSGWRYEAIVVGASIEASNENADATRLGQFALGGDPGKPELTGSPAAIGTCPCGGGIYDDSDSYHCRRCGLYRGGSTYPINAYDVGQKWRQAGNLVQWNGVDAQPKPRVLSASSEPLVPLAEVQSFFGNLSAMLEDD